MYVVCVVCMVRMVFMESKKDKAKDETCRWFCLLKDKATNVHVRMVVHGFA